MDINIHSVERITRRNATHSIGDKEFHTIDLTFYYTDWLGKEHSQSICLFSNNPMEIEDADSTTFITEDV